MKKLIIVLFLLPLLSLSQVSISTKGYSTKKYNSAKKEWYEIKSDTQDATLMEFNKEFTMMKHTTLDMNTTYYLSNINTETFKGREQTDMIAVSDIGNRYWVIIDIEMLFVRFIFYANDGEKVAVDYFIKYVF